MLQAFFYILDENKISFTSGKEIYSKLSSGGGMCVACHLPNGKGQPGAIPPLADSDWVLGDKERLIKISIHGLQGEIAVNGKKYARF